MAGQLVDVHEIQERYAEMMCWAAVKGLYRDYIGIT